MDINRVVWLVAERIIAGETVPIKKEFQRAIVARLKEKGVTDYKVTPKEDNPDILVFKSSKEDAA